MNGLSKEIGMKTTPSTILDLVLGYISERYVLYHQLPESKIDGIEMVFSVLNDVSTRYIVENKDSSSFY